MDDHLARLEATVQQLRSAVESLEQRVGLLEAQRAGMTAPPGEGPAEQVLPARPGIAQAGRVSRDTHDPIAVLALIGRLFLVLAGGFFLRAMTEAGLFVPRAGIAMAFAYGLVWLFLADRSSRRQEPTSAAFHAIAFAMVTFPLLIEATTRFEVLTGTGGVLGLILASAGLLLVAWRRRMLAATWVTVIAALPTSAILLLKTGDFVPFALFVIALGVVALWLSYELGWTAIRWPTALAADLVVAGVTLLALAQRHPGAPRAALILQWSLLGAYLVSFAVRTLVRGRVVGWFEWIQAVTALLISFGGTVLLTRTAGTPPAMLGVGSLVVGTACYGIAFGVASRRGELERNAYFYATLALVLVLAGCSFLFRAPWPGVAFAVLAIVATGLWARLGRPDMLLHGAAYVLAAGTASGALSYGAHALVVIPAGAWAPPGAVVLVTLAASLLSVGLAAARPAPEAGPYASGLRLLLVVACAWIAAGCVTGWLAAVAAGTTDDRVDVGALATVRTGVLALGTLLIAWIGGYPRFREWTWLVYPLLVVIGLKMVAQDFGQSRPATLFIALALYGAALIVAPRFRKRRARGSDAVAGRPTDASPL